MTMRIGPNGWPQAAATGQAARREAGFRLRPRQAAPAAGVSLSGPMPALDRVLSSPRDVLARRRGRALLGGLGELQRALLGGQPDAAALHRLAGLVEGEDGDDPDMAEAMRALALRARIELARRGLERGEAPLTPR